MKTVNSPYRFQEGHAINCGTEDQESYAKSFVCLSKNIGIKWIIVIDRNLKCVKSTNQP